MLKCCPINTGVVFSNEIAYMKTSLSIKRNALINYISYLGVKWVFVPPSRAAALSEFQPLWKASFPFSGHPLSESAAILASARSAASVWLALVFSVLTQSLLDPTNWVYVSVRLCKKPSAAHSSVVVVVRSECEVVKRPRKRQRQFRTHFSYTRIISSAAKGAIFAIFAISGHASWIQFVPFWNKAFKV